MSRRANFILQGAEPVIWQTPGRVQYFRAENEPFIPGKPIAILITPDRRGQMGSQNAKSFCHAPTGSQLRRRGSKANRSFLQTERVVRLPERQQRHQS